MLKIGDAYYRLKEGLQHIYDEGEATALAHQAMEALTGMSRLERLTDKYQALGTSLEARFSEMEQALLKGEPIQYVLGEAIFLERTFKVNSNVLIPRPETEELVEWILKNENPASLLDVGTGSGCISISLALGLPNASVRAIDVSEGALNVARENAIQLGAAVHFQQVDFLNEEERNALSSFEVIVSNPPYIPINEAETLHQNVRDFEPGTALFVPNEDPLLFYRKLAEFGKTHLIGGGSIYCELHQNYAAETARMFVAEGYENVEVRNDAFGNARMVRVKTKS
jgi:release factor glutamine methyltransferase